MGVCGLRLQDKDPWGGMLSLKKDELAMNVQVVGRESMVLGFAVVFGFRMRAPAFRRFRECYCILQATMPAAMPTGRGLFLHAIPGVESF